MQVVHYKVLPFAGDDETSDTGIVGVPVGPSGGASDISPGGAAGALVLSRPPVRAGRPNAAHAGCQLGARSVALRGRAALLGT